MILCRELFPINVGLNTHYGQGKTFVDPVMNRNWVASKVQVVVTDFLSHLSAEAFTMPFTIVAVFPCGRVASSDLYTCKGKG
jgi:hypothetical protein